MTILVVSATSTEARYVAEYLGDRARLVVTGIGKTAAAAGTARALALDPSVTEVVNIGSCGALHDHLEGLHVVSRVLNHDLSAAALRAFVSFVRANGR